MAQLIKRYGYADDLCRLIERDDGEWAKWEDVAPLLEAPNTGNPKLPPCNAELRDLEVWPFAAQHKFRFCPYCGRQLREGV